jgi:hypothetical protein
LKCCNNGITQSQFFSPLLLIYTLVLSFLFLSFFFFFLTTKDNTSTIRLLWNAVWRVRKLVHRRMQRGKQQIHGGEILFDAKQLHIPRCNFFLQRSLFWNPQGFRFSSRVCDSVSEWGRRKQEKKKQKQKTNRNR